MNNDKNSHMHMYEERKIFLIIPIFFFLYSIIVLHSICLVPVLLSFLKKKRKEKKGLIRSW